MPAPPVHPDAAARPRRRRLWLALLLVLLLVAVLAVAAVLGNRHVVPDREPQKVQLTPEQLQRGRYLARAADCAACHSTAEGEAFAGGVPLKTPFGTLYGTNITPHPERGIGRWSAEEFYRAVTLGRAPGGRHLYPAMPYVSYHHMAREDSDLIYGYLMNQRASAQADRAPDVPFPLNVRLLLAGWNLLFFDKDPLPAASQGQGAAWQRGRYLANVMGHCGECHTPRGALGQVKRGEWLQGYTLERRLAPDLRPAQLAARGWSGADLQRYLRTGMAPQATASGEMLPVVRNSLQYLDDADLTALTTFLLGDTPPPATPLPAPAAGTVEKLAAGRQTYLNVCAGCHGTQGQGVPNTMPPLKGSSSVRMPDARNLAVTVLDGVPAQQLAHGMATSEMPAFAGRLSDAQIAELLNYLRTSWGGQPGDVTAGQVGGWRQGQ